MVTRAVNKILQEAKSLSEAERTELLRTLLEAIDEELGSLHGQEDWTPSENLRAELRAARALHRLFLSPHRQREVTHQEQVREALVRRGLLEAEPPRGKDPDRYRRWQPVPIKGRPLSETIVEERR